MILKRGWIVALVLVGSMVSALAAWAEPSGEITIWGWPTHDKAYETMIAGFNEKYPNISVKWEMVPETANALSTAIAAGDGLPDVTAIEINHIDRFVFQGGFVDLL